MSACIIFSENESLSMFYESLISTHLELDCVNYYTNKESSPCNTSCVVVDLECYQYEKLIEPFINFHIHIPFIFVGSEEKIWQAKKVLKSKTLCFYLPLSASLEEIERIIEKCNVNRKAHSASYSKININLFDTKREIMCDIYLKIKEDKYIKLFNRYDIINESDLKKYKEKSVTHFYVRTRDYKLIMQKVARRILRAESDNEPAMTIISDSKLGSLCSIALQETIAESISTLGLNEDAITMATFAINKTLDIVHGHSKHFDILQSSLHGQNYISEHSFVTSYIASALCKETFVYKEQNIIALCVAAFFHDISFEDFDNAIIQSEHDKAFQDLGILGNKDIFEHIERAVKIVNEIQGIPDNTITIISQHHERYEGGGFPQGIDYKMIHPLSVIFNLSHELALYLYSSGQSQAQLEELLDDMIKRYDKGTYNEFAHLLKQILFPEIGKVTYKSA